VGFLIPPFLRARTFWPASGPAPGVAARLAGENVLAVMRGERVNPKTLLNPEVYKDPS